ncbi:MAG: NAD-dependent epimerase/dehydratase family protein [Candidatus Thiodiazotropha endolucinida]
MGKNVLVTGATGMIGSLVLKHCLASDEVASAISLTRRPSGIQHEKLNKVIIYDFLHLDENAPYLKSVDVVFYCLGVYTGAVDRKTFRTITVDYPEALGKVLKEKSPYLKFCLLSGAGADRSEKSRFMFAEDKGTIENRLSEMDFAAFHAFRPGYIYPVMSRREPNFSYRLMRWLYPAIRFFGPNASIKSTELAEAMVKVGLNGSELEILENRDILKITGRQKSSN